MPNERQTLTAKRNELLAANNKSGAWSQERYDEIMNLGKRIAALPEDPPAQPELELKPPRKPR